ncbi:MULTISPECIES: DUF6089 family protein [unclassified Leeuwenhoekiella]|uniref:type IX secretion system protein PorG n=1 Tax=unclassified Leeuwenhoekiella TaxID=2615029 RepID=UPI000C535628|nr:MULTISPECIES: DUF6089 family protein [unclassified Leeuwenhoekiella]MAW96601.1 hypothetical protein [Leeuwenhoekiella sp.]MBA81489.1 hypothetical protein [Leeuwenhoekiella sp.]|tara:strand:+ start:16321 stop:17052 length:732 start_codon:yes stop_codon:yes gene_type:complete
MIFRTLIVLSSFFILGLHTVSAQTSYDLGLYLGGVNYYGEIGKKAFIAPNRAFFGVIGKMNFTESLSARASVTYLTLADNDRDVNGGYRAGRGQDLYYSFEHTNIEASVGLEFVPFSFLKNSYNPIDFYIYGGVGAIYGDEAYYPLSSGFEDVQSVVYGNRTRLTIPMGAGIKTFVARNFMLGIELAPRYSLSDNLDGSYPDDERVEANRLFNFENNDWYTFIGLTLTYRFGKGSDAYCDCTL